MSKFLNQMVYFKNAYTFEKLDKALVEQRLLHELVFQLRDLEQHWIQLGQWKEDRSLNEEIRYQRHLERINFRLEETKRFLEEYKGPRIILFVCSEIYDLILEQQVMKISLSQQIIRKVGAILTVMTTSFLPVISELQLTTEEEVPQSLIEEAEKLMNRFSGKNREESLQELSEFKSGRKDGIDE